MSDLHQYLKDLEAIPLSCEHLLKMGGLVYFNDKTPRLKCMLYDDIPNHTNIDTFMNNLDSLIILYQIKADNTKEGSRVGHFICICRQSHGKYSHFDSYGLDIDEEMHITHENPEIIKNLLAGVQFDTNKKKLQQFRNETQTCGLWALFRSLFFEMNNAQFLNYIKPLLKMISGDDLVTLIFRFLIKKDG